MENLTREKVMLGKKSRFQRKTSALTQANLGARAFGVSKSIGQTRIKNFELGKGRAPTEKELAQICSALGIDMDTLNQSPEEPIKRKKGFCLDNECLLLVASDRYFPELKTYAEMSVAALKAGDEDLLMRIVESLAKIVIAKVKERRKIHHDPDKRLHLQNDKSGS